MAHELTMTDDRATEPAAKGTAWMRRYRALGWGYDYVEDPMDKVLHRDGLAAIGMVPLAVGVGVMDDDLSSTNWPYARELVVPTSIAPAVAVLVNEAAEAIVQAVAERVTTPDATPEMDWPDAAAGIRAAVRAALAAKADEPADDAGDDDSAATGPDSEDEIVKRRRDYWIKTLVSGAGVVDDVAERLASINTSRGVVPWTATEPVMVVVQTTPNDDTTRCELSLLDLQCAVPPGLAAGLACFVRIASQEFVRAALQRSVTPASEHADADAPIVHGEDDWCGANHDLRCELFNSAMGAISEIDWYGTPQKSDAAHDPEAVQAGAGRGGAGDE